LRLFEREIMGSREEGLNDMPWTNEIMCDTPSTTKLLHMQSSAMHECINLTGRPEQPSRGIEAPLTHRGLSQGCITEQSH
jgi:hypothetical protein